MAAYGRADYLRVLTKVADTEDHQLVFYDVDYSACRHPDGGPEYDHHGWSPQDRLVIEASLEKGLLREHSGNPDGDPSWRRHMLKLTAHGNDFLKEQTAFWLRKQLNALGQNVVTIIVTVLIALLSAWLLKLTGLN